jgi:hypothetical protein
MECMTRECGSSSRTFKSALLWVIAESPRLLCEEARKLLAWKAIEDESTDLKLDETQQRQLAENIEKAKRDLRDAVWRSYKHVFLLGKDNALREIDLGQVHYSAADSPILNILNRLTAEGELEKGISVRLLVKNWPAAFAEWPVKSAKNALYASPLFPRIIKGTEAIQDAVSKGVSQGEFAYVGKSSDGKYQPMVFRESLLPGDVEVVDELFLIKKEIAESYIKAEAPTCSDDGKKTSTGIISPDTTSTRQSGESGAPPAGETGQPTGGIQGGREQLTFSGMSWSGEIPPQKWMNFYTKVLAKFASGGSGLKLKLNIEVSPEGGLSKQKIEETKSALRELGLSDGVNPQ